MTTQTTYRKTILVDGQQIPAHLIWTDEGHTAGPDSYHTWRLIDGRYRHETTEGTVTQDKRPFSANGKHGSYMPTRVIAVRVPAGNPAIKSLWNSHLKNVGGANLQALIGLADEEDAGWLKIAGKVKLIHENRAGHIDNSKRNGMTLRLELSL